LNENFATCRGVQEKEKLINLAGKEEVQLLLNLPLLYFCSPFFGGKKKQLAKLETGNIIKLFCRTVVVAFLANLRGS